MDGGDAQCTSLSGSTHTHTKKTLTGFSHDDSMQKVKNKGVGEWGGVIVILVCHGIISLLLLRGC